jgi:hypothetical protein
MRRAERLRRVQAGSRHPIGRSIHRQERGCAGRSIRAADKCLQDEQRPKLYIWQLSSVTDIATDRGYGTASTRYCKVTVITSPAEIVQQLNTEDQNAGTGVPGLLGVYGSMCDQRLGMKPNT